MGNNDFNSNDFFNTDTPDDFNTKADDFNTGADSAAPVPDFFTDPGQGNYAVPNPIPQDLDYLSFTQLDQVKKEAGRMKTAGILCLVSAGITCLLGVAFGQYGIFIDAAVVAVLGLLIMLRKSFVASVLLGVYAAINAVTSIMASGHLGGWLIILAAIYSIFASWTLRKAWKQYQETGSFTV